MATYNQNDKRELIMDHYSNPLHKKELETYDVLIQSPRCVDELKLKVEFNDDLIKDIVYDAKGCAVFQSSSDIVIDEIIGKTKDEALFYIEEYQKAISGESYNDELLDKSSIYDNVKSHLNRYDCANMIYRGIKELIK